ncbi:uncharacterized protein LOC110612406 isoform X1 [Manihot esculenta]|uniref:Uncharacterized protein n=2 Tax=Manihot esculenta TaxID=3983 RepID=A0A251L5I9_MANES|nr:uncharacterized protein LOC110612406 isoform X1 [Manihot esculenta]KAG8656803.1 hypothetical protein MANES_03G008000v8 [Manihot esculenta]OAY53586.1 hypothetical protein MANES_03G008000v8 [Manihot esculenta]OAY53587.1 hypothetical protein MANES_03G008000v8 [Manihot esculenta]
MLKHKTSQSQSTEEDKFKLKHQSLLQDFLEFQKEFVSKKKKLQMTKQKRDILSTEIRFLRQRYRYLMAMKSHNLQLQQDPAPPENSSMQSEDIRKLLSTKKKPKHGIINGKSVEKKISWQDQTTVMNV